MHKFGSDKHEGECGCGGMCMWMDASKEDLIKILEKKEERIKKMLDHVQKTKESLAAGEDEDDDDED